MDNIYNDNNNSSKYLIISPMHGTTKKRPGPFAPPLNVRPRRNMTALSYSFTIYCKICLKISNFNNFCMLQIYIDAKPNAYTKEV